MYVSFFYLDTKKRGIVLLSIPRVEALALPIKVEQTTSEATPYENSPYTCDQYIREILYPFGYNKPLQGHGGCEKSHPGHLPLHCPRL